MYTNKLIGVDFSLFLLVGFCRLSFMSDRVRNESVAVAVRWVQMVLEVRNASFLGVYMVNTGLADMKKEALANLIPKTSKHRLYLLHE